MSEGMPKKSQNVSVIGFIKFRDQIGLYRADPEAWVLNVRAYAKATRRDLSEFAKRKDKRFDKDMLSPIRKDDIQKVIDWFDSNAQVHPDELASDLSKMDYRELNQYFEDSLPVLLYDFDERVGFENPDRNPYTAYDDYLPEGWQNIVVEGYDALVPDAFNYWSRFEARLEDREEGSL